MFNKNREAIGFALDTTNVADVKFDHLHPDAVICLESCSTGRGENPIAQQIANIAKRTVFAPNKDSEGTPQVTFTNKIPSFSVNSPFYAILPFTPKN